MFTHLLITLFISAFLMLPVLAAVEKLQTGMVNPGYEENRLGSRIPFWIFGRISKRPLL